MENIIELKKKYNAALARNKKAELYMQSKSVEECLKPLKVVKGKDFTTVDLFNEVASELSRLRKEIEQLIYRNMTTDEILNGFN